MTIPLKQISPSSITTFDGCQMQWFLSYILKYREPPGKAAVIGSCCHAILEGVAQSVQLRSKRGKKDRVVTNKSIGEIGTKYKLDDLTEKSYQFFVNGTPELKFTNADRDEVYNNIRIAANHRLFPENHKRIISTESFFNKSINEEWAKYTTVDNGEIIEKEVRIVGVIDLVYVDHSDQIQYLDYKFGKPYDWAGGYDKTFENLGEDIQLCLYYWAMKEDYAEDIGTNIWYVKAEKTFELTFDEVNRQKALDKIRDVILLTKNMQKPATNYSWKCSKFCQFSKKTFSDFGVNVDLPHVKGARFSDINGKMCMCDTANVLIDKRGINLVIENCKKV